MKFILFYLIYYNKIELCDGAYGYCKERSDVEFIFTSSEVNTCCHVVQLKSGTPINNGQDIDHTLPGVDNCLFNR